MALITTKALEALRGTDDGKRLPDGGSMFGMVRATPDTKNHVSVDFQWWYKLGGKTRQVRIGSWPKMSLKALRDERDRLAVEVKSGTNPVQRKATEKLKIEVDQVEAHNKQLDRLEVIAEQQARLTVRQLFKLWRDLALKQSGDGGAEAQRAFERDVVRMTKRVLSDLRQMFGFALDRDYVEADPTARIKKAKIGPDGERDRVLGEAELIDLLKKLPQSGLAETSQCALLIQMATITRIGETVGARWEHVDFERLHAITGETPWCFPGSRYDPAIEKTNLPLDTKTVTKQVADRQREPGGQIAGRTKQIDALKLGGGQWRPHDLRRTGASAMAELGALPDVIEKCLNHTEENKMKRIYQRATFEAPMRDAWRLWGERLDLLTNKPANVVTLRAA